MPLRAPSFMPRRLLALALVVVGIAPALRAADVEFDSPKKNFHVVVSPQNAEGSDLLPLRVRLSPAGGGAPVETVTHLAGYRAPDAERAARLLHFSPDETSVAIDNPVSLSLFGYRLVALAQRPWSTFDVQAEGAEWADDDRLVYRGQASDAFYIGVFDARTGREIRADPSLSMYTDFELVHVTPATLVFREEDTANKLERCLSLDQKGRRRVVRCPGP